ncbi:MAG TPA: ADP-glyceromanno-heptose 6-epimerase [Sulfurospirillum sp. UBA12182]|nr:MAG TPA: ADP-glyceromanno-heptose 6-epimerase [Sulfurospirillum sp. UBA12182]
MPYTDIDFNKKSVLITGGAGFIGSNLAFYFQKNYPTCKVVVFDKFRSTQTFSNRNLMSFGHFKNLLGFKGEVISGDINSKEDIEKLKKYKFDYIFHEAAISDTTVSDQTLMIQTNVNAFKALLDLALEMNADMIYASSAATYGDSDKFSIGYESPNNVYGFSKLMMDNLAAKYIENSPIRIVGLRYFNVYGEREFFKDKTASMVLQFGLQLLKGESAKLFEGSDKIQRDFIYIEDVIGANIKACKAKKSGVYNVGTGKARSFQDIVDVLKNELKIQREDIYIPNPFIGQYQFFTEADISLTQEFLEYEPRFSLEEGIRAYIPEIKRIYNNG